MASSTFTESRSPVARRPTYSTRPMPVRSLSLKSCTPTAPLVTSPIAQRSTREVAIHQPTDLLERFIQSVRELESYKQGRPVTVDGHTLSISAVAAAARHNATAVLDDSPYTKSKLLKSRKLVADKVDQGISVYGVSTGFGGSADTRTDKPILLGNALLQLLHSGVAPTSAKTPDVLPLQDPLACNTMPESWVRAAILVRMNSLIRGHSGVRWELIEKMNELLSANITPVIPLRGSISASGDLSPLSYIAGTLIGNPTIRVFDGPTSFGARKIVSAPRALEAHGISNLPLASKEHLGILNGTAFSAGVAALALNDAVHLALLSQVCTAMGTEALAGTKLSFDAFINCTARPHPGQIETAKNIWNLLEGSRFASSSEEEVSITEDDGVLRQDRYALRTAAQFIGPQVEDILHSLDTITIECNSTTDNPLIDGETGKVHHGGNFQAMSVTNAMEKTRLSLHHIGKILFAQCTELMNPDTNRGLPPSLAATDPSLDYHCKGLDIGTAAYVAELGYLANPVSTHIQSAEMHNQAVNSMALVSARATINSLEVLTILISSYLYALCQALDLRALQHEFMEGLSKVVSEEADAHFHDLAPEADLTSLKKEMCITMHGSFESTSTVDNAARMVKVADSVTSLLFGALCQKVVESGPEIAVKAVSAIPKFRQAVSSRLSSLMDTLRKDYLTGTRGPAPASAYLNKTRHVYEFVRIALGIKMHGVENFNYFENGMGVDDVTVGEKVSIINEAIRDGKMQSVVVKLFS